MSYIIYGIISNMNIEIKQSDIIIKTLLKSGAFAISEVERGSKMSRSGIGKLLHGLVEKNILAMTADAGAAVRYKLVVNDQALIFLFQGVDQLMIDEIARAWNVSTLSAKKYIKKFVDSGLLIKRGLPPKKIVYVHAMAVSAYDFSAEQKNIIDKYYAYTTPDGQLLPGERGFVHWAENKSGRKDIESLAQEYLETRKKYYNDKNRVLLIDATDKLSQVFGDSVYLEKLFHRDFDALPVFGKTYLSQMVRIAKSGHTNTAVMLHIVEQIQQSLNQLVFEYRIDAIGFIPPTVMRKTQLMSFLAKRLDIDLPIIIITKAENIVPVQQKSLKKIEDRILNANKTIVIKSNGGYKNVLLIDDVTGSGATLNETAKKIITQGIGQKVYGFTITGSAKAGVFDIISEA